MPAEEFKKLSPEQLQKLSRTINDAKALTNQQAEIIEDIIAGEIDVGKLRISYLNEYFDTYSKSLDLIARKHSALNDAFLILDQKIGDSYKRAASEVAKAASDLETAAAKAEASSKKAVAANAKKSDVDEDKNSTDTNASQIQQAGVKQPQAKQTTLPQEAMLKELLAIARNINRNIDGYKVNSLQNNGLFGRNTYDTKNSNVGLQQYSSAIENKTPSERAILDGVEKSELDSNTESNLLRTTDISPSDTSQINVALEEFKKTAEELSQSILNNRAAAQRPQGIATTTVGETSTSLFKTLLNALQNNTTVGRANNIAEDNSKASIGDKNISTEALMRSHTEVGSLTTVDTELFIGDYFDALKAGNAEVAEDAATIKARESDAALRLSELKDQQATLEAEQVDAVARKRQQAFEAAAGLEQERQTEATNRIIELTDLARTHGQAVYEAESKAQGLLANINNELASTVEYANWISHPNNGAARLDNSSQSVTAGIRDPANSAGNTGDDWINNSPGANQASNGTDSSIDDAITHIQEAVTNIQDNVVDIRDTAADDSDDLNSVIENIQEAAEDIVNSTTNNNANVGNIIKSLTGAASNVLYGALGVPGIAKALELFGKLDGVIHNIGKRIGRLDTTINKIAPLKGFVDTRLQGSSNNTTTSGSYWDWIVKDITGISAYNPYFKQEAFAENTKELVNQGIAFDLEQRAFLMTIQEKIANTFNAADGTLLRLIRIQQEDSTAGRLGMESALNSFLNTMYENTEYLNEVAKSVRISLTEMEALMSGAEATEVEYQVQKWMGSLYSVGMSQEAVTSITKVLGQIGAGDIEGLTGGGTSNLLVMAANEAGLSIADILTGGLNAKDTNKLLQAVVEYLAELAASSKDNNVVQQQLAKVFGVSASDLRAATNLEMGGSVGNIYEEYKTYDNMLSKLISMSNSMGDRMGHGELLQNIWDNVIYSLAGSIASSPIAYGTFKVASMLDKEVGGIPLPDILALGSGVQLNTTIADLMRVASLGTGIIDSFIPLISGLTSSFSGKAMLEKLGITDGSGLAVTPRGGEYSDSVGAAGGTVSESGYYAGNASSNDIKNSTIQEANDTKKQLMVEAKEVEEANQVTSINNTILKIYELLDDVAHGSGYLRVKVEGYGLTKAGSSNSSIGGVNALSSLSNGSFSSGGLGNENIGSTLDDLGSNGIGSSIDFGGWTTTM